MESHLNLQIEKLGRELERIKFDVNDVMDQKSDAMQRNFDVEIATIKDRYNSAVKLVTEASNNLGELFKQKMVKVKTRITKFFAETEIKFK